MFYLYCLSFPVVISRTFPKVRIQRFICAILCFSDCDFIIYNVIYTWLLDLYMFPLFRLFWVCETSPQIGDLYLLMYGIEILYVTDVLPIVSMMCVLFTYNGISRVFDVYHNTTLLSVLSHLVVYIIHGRSRTQKHWCRWQSIWYKITMTLYTLEKCEATKGIIRRRNSKNRQ